MSGTHEQPPQSAGSAESKSQGPLSQEERNQDVWTELFGIVQGLSETMGLALQAFTPSDDRAVSAITKKRLALRSVQGLKQGQNELLTLLEHLKALQAASQTWQRSMMYASKSHQEMMEQIESTTEELHTTSERLRVIESQRLAAVRESESLRARTAQQDTLIKEVQGALKHREEELETLQFTVFEMQSSTSVTQQNLERLGQAAAHADERAVAAATALDEAKADATKAQGLAERHQQVVAKLTADNLVFLMQLKKVEADLAAANQERTQLRLAVEQQRGPWFDQVRAGVEERVRQALQKSQELEVRLEKQEEQHAAQLEVVRLQRAQLEEQLEAVRSSAAELAERLEAALELKQRADDMSAAAESASRELRQRLDDLAAENRVLQESVRAMRQECTERWVHEQAALGRVSGLQERVEELEGLLSQQGVQVAALQRQLDTQAGVNRQLMARKEEVEWQLMAAMAKVDGGADQPVPMNLRVSGLLQVGGPNQHASTEGQGPLSESARRTAAVEAADSDMERSRKGAAGGDRMAGGSGGGAEPHRPPSASWMPEAGHSSQPPQPHPLPSQAGAGQYGGTVQPAVDGPKTGGSPYSGGPPLRTALAAGVLGYTDAFGIWPGGEVAQYQQTLPSWPHGHYITAPQPRNTTEEPPVKAGSSDSTLLPEPTLQFRNQDGGPVARYDHGRVGGVDELGPAQPRRAVAGRDDSTVEMQGRRASVEAASTVVSSPPSSVALSTEPGSPRELSRVPSVTSGQDLGAAAVTIRTVSAGLRPTAGGRNGAGRAGQGQQQGFEPSHSAGEDPAVAGARGSSHARAAGLDALGRRGSLHDGGDIWLADVASSTSSDDSDFFFTAGMAAHQEARGDGGAPGRPPHQALLYQLQEELQVQLLAPAGLVGMGAAQASQHSERAQQEGRGGGAGPSAGAVAPHQQGASQPSDTPQPRGQVVPHVSSDKDEDGFRSRPAPQRGGDSGAGSRPAIVMRTTPSRPAGSAQGASPGADRAAASMYARNDRNESGAGVFSIVKGSGPQQGARGGPSGSPVHPAFQGAAPHPAYPASHASPAASPQRPPAAATGSAAAAGGERFRTPAPALMVAATGSRATAAGAVMDRAPVSGGVPPGASSYSPGVPLSGNAVAAMERWASSEGPQGPSTIPPALLYQPHHQQHQQHQHHHQDWQQQRTSVPPSPARSTTSPRSPPHPALIIAADRAATAWPSASAAGGLLAVRDSALSTRTESIAGAPTSMPGLRPAPGALYDSRPLPGGHGSDWSVPDGAAATTAPADPPTVTAARPRVSFHGLLPDQEGAAVDSSGNSGTALARTVSVASSTASSLYGNSTHNAGPGLQPPRPSSVKSVRFSDHDQEDTVLPQAAPQQREEQDLSGMGWSTRSGLRASQSGQDNAQGRRPFQRAAASFDGEGRPATRVDSDHRFGQAGGSHGPPPYRSLGPVQHPALMGSAAFQPAQGSGSAHGQEVPETTPSKRYSAAGVVTTAVPRGGAGGTAPEQRHP